MKKTTRTISRAPSDPQRRSRVLEVACAHFGRDGYKKTSMDAIALEADCAKGSLYLDFPSKEALLDAAIAHALEQATQRYLADLAGVDSPREQLKRTLQFAFREMGRSPMLERLVREDQELGLISAYARQARQKAEAGVQLEAFRAVLREGIRRGELRADLDLELTPFVLNALKFLHFYTDLMTADLISRERLLEAVIEVFMAGVSAPEGGRE
jgi:AcrR family transcriptional regulator